MHSVSIDLNLILLISLNSVRSNVVDCNIFCKVPMGGKLECYGKNLLRVFKEQHVTILALYPVKCSQVLDY